MMAYFSDIHAPHNLNELTHCGLVTPYGDIDLSQHNTGCQLPYVLQWPAGHCSTYGNWHPVLCIQKQDLVNSLWLNDSIWHWKSWSTLVQVMACCLMAPSHYLNQCWLKINEILQHPFQGNVYLNTQNINPQVVLEFAHLKSQPRLPGNNELTHWGQDKMDAISQTTFSN